MRETLAAVSRIEFPPQALCYGCSRWPDEGLEFSACRTSPVAREQTAVLTSSRHAKMIEKGTLATDSVSGLGAW